MESATRAQRRRGGREGGREGGGREGTEHEMEGIVEMISATKSSYRQLHQLQLLHLAKHIRTYTTTHVHV